MSGMKMYISGKITGDDDYRSKFAAKELELTRQGYNIVNPCCIGEHEFLSYEDFMHVDFALIDVCDAIYMMRDWKSSSGAQRELSYARAKGKKVFFEEEDQ